MNTQTVARSIRLFSAASALVVITACGGGGGGGDSQSAGGPAPPTSPPPPPPPPAGANVSIPLAAGKRWVYDVERTNTFGGQLLEFVGERVLHAEEQLTWQGRTAWKLAQYELENQPRADKPGFEVAHMYVSQGPEGLDKWDETNQEWRGVLSTRSSRFDNNTFLMAGGPRHAEGTELSSAGTITVPAGDFQAVLAHHEFVQTNAPVDIFEERWEHYADGVGLIRAAWEYSKDDNDPSASDESTTGTVELKGIDAGPVMLNETEPNNNDDGTPTSSQAVTLGSIVAAQTHISDPGRLVSDVNVSPNAVGLKLLQDWYRFELTASGAHRIDLAYDVFNNANSHLDDLDLYLFQERAGVLLFVGRSVFDPATNEGRFGEWISANLLPATYYIAVQAWNTPTDAVQYWLSVR